jgi:hypothetical protein
MEAVGTHYTVDLCVLLYGVLPRKGLLSTRIPLGYLVVFCRMGRSRSNLGRVSLDILVLSN